MAQKNPQGVQSTTVMETSDSEDSVEEVPLPVVQPKPSITPKPKNGGIGRGKKKTTKQSDGEFDLVWDLPDSGNEVTNKCKIGKNKEILILT